MSDEALWWIALGAGLAVAVVAWALLHLLLRRVLRIEEVANGIWHTGKLVAGNTANSWQLDALSGRLDALAAEVGHHDALLRTGSSALEDER